MPPTIRTRTDACPGVVSPHAAADGALARIRLPGGTIGAPALRAVAALAREAGDGTVHLTSRGNLQLRGLDPADPRPVEHLTAAGLLPSRTHERVRNVLASPLSGLDGGLADVRGLAAALDRGLCARPALSALPGRFLFALDDGRGDVAAERPDLCWRAEGPDRGELLVADTPTGVSCSPAEAPGLLLDAATAFLDVRAAHAADPAARAWRAAELPGAATAVASRLGDHTPSPSRHDDRSARLRPPEGGDVLVGASDGGALGVAPVLGALSAGQLERLAAEGAPELLVTPWRTLVLPVPAPGAADRLAAGLVVDPGHPALRVSACAGSPGCARSLADVRAHALALVARGGPRADAGPEAVHVVGCGRRCGAPHTPHRDAVATGPDTYVIDGHTITTEELR
ncbi:precorrin-3B synthase [Pseudonocardia sp. ICBG1293]|uniref:precorrin-3B synthase n=1 Tax=Pseudonocardia sp. ICBG1293 TaxID=2844382 RepID=UPI001CCFC8CE|nr:precorrin-3B synthase [Pseudonocardia sp. ICBG1293]